MKYPRNVIVLFIVAFVALMGIAVMIFAPSIVSNFSDVVGYAAHPLYPTFSSPESGFTINNNILSTSDYAIYKTGYYSINGANWQPFNLTGNTLSGNWLTGTATYTLPSFGTGESYIVIYSCSKTNSVWDCHDGTTGRWQLQIINSGTSSAPQITFIPPTPNTAATINTSSTEIKANITDDSNTISSWIDFDKSLVGYWSMDYYNASGIYDNSTYKNFGKYNGINSSNIITGIRGKGLKFNATVNQYIDCGSTPSLNLPTSSDITLAAWVNISGSSPYSYEVIAGKEFANYFLAYSPGNGNFIGIINGNDCFTYTTSSSVSFNTWYFVTSVFKSGSQPQMYVNGILDPGTSYSNNNCVLAYSTTDNYIGNDNSKDYPFNGTIDEVMIFNRALSASEVKALYDSKLNKFDATLTNLANGQHNYTVYAVDGSGNTVDSGQKTFNVNAVGCTPLCSGKQCGSDGCSGTCGNCLSNQTCNSNGVCVNNVVSSFCGDTLCNGNETCSTCPIDCGTCQSYKRTFYVSNSGSDSNNGTDTGHPWQTISKVNSHSFLPGDGILFKRGDTWYGTLTVSSSGSSTAPITYGAYGTGEKPIITGFTTITGWTNEGGGIYSKVVPTQSAPNMVTVDGVNTWMGRYPNTGWLTYESSGSGYIVDNQLSGSPDWTGAEVVIKKEGYITDRSSITRHSGNTIYYDKSSTVGDDGNAGWGYFIENDIRTLTTLGEWYYDDNTNKFYMYFGAITPTTKIVKVASLNNGVSSSQSYVTFDNINFQGFNVGFNLDNSNHITVTNCEVGFTGGYGVVLGTNNLYDNLYLHDTNADGFSGSSDGFTLTNSIIENIGMIEGSGYGYGGRGSAMDYWGSNALIQYNTFRNIGLVAVGQIGNDVTIDSNFFDNCCAKSFDCGAIYMNNNGGNTNRVVSNNIIINTIGSASGTTETQFPNQWVTAEGIYLDEPCSGVTIEGNSISTINGCGIKLHESYDIIIRDNTIYNAFEGYQFLGSGAQPNDPIRNVDMDRNIVVAMDPSQFIFVFMAHTLNDINLFGTSDNQYYVRPVNDGIMHDFWTNQASDGDWGNFRPWSTANPAPAGTWQAKIGQQDLDSHFSEGLVTSTNDVRFEYNPTKINKIITLNGNYVDIKGIAYSGSVTLAPYTSIVLIKN